MNNCKKKGMGKNHPPKYTKGTDRRSPPHHKHDVST